MPFNITYEDISSPLELILHAANGSEMTVNVLAWQLNLKLKPIDEAQGELLFRDIMTPPEPLFGPLSQPQCVSCDSEPLPTRAMLVSDADMSQEFDGAPIPDGAARNILLLELVASADANGTFELLMPEYDADNPDSSSWISADEEFALPQAFENTAGSSDAGSVLLGTIHVVTDPSTQQGDYNSDGDVTFADYQCWRADFGSVVERRGTGADGNGDGFVDTADYVLWRRHVTSDSHAFVKIMSITMPEPSALALMSFGFVASLLAFDRPRRWHQTIGQCSLDAFHPQVFSSN
jgi:hypothetical protein